MGRRAFLGMAVGVATLALAMPARGAEAAQRTSSVSVEVMDTGTAMSSDLVIAFDSPSTTITRRQLRQSLGTRALVRMRTNTTRPPGGGSW